MITVLSYIHERLGRLLLYIPEAPQPNLSLKYALFVSGGFALAIVIGFLLLALLLYTLKVFKLQIGLSHGWRFFKSKLGYIGSHCWLMQSFSCGLRLFCILSCVSISVIILVFLFVIATYIWIVANSLKAYYGAKGCPLLVNDAIGLVAITLVNLLLLILS